ncbi:MAG: hypothetical protein IJI87_09585 [Mogibacterium sp.]|nr:hypothetical protein [Mogibacterium sp.]
MNGVPEDLKYYIFDPTGNITALVESEVTIADQPAAAARIMELEPDVEQVGFVTYAEDAAAAEGSVPVSLRMAGGEFCGNATMCAAALFAIRRGLQGGAVPVKVSGATAPIKVLLERQAENTFSAAVSMPPAVSIDELRLADGMLPDSDSLNLPIVWMEGISHVIIEPDSGFFGLKDDPALAETLLRSWCSVLGADCLGMMFLGEGAALRPMIPLVYVPGADTMFWENSCASGSAAAGMYLAAKAGSPVDVTFYEPAGRMRVESDPATGRTVLHGSVRLIL